MCHLKETILIHEDGHKETTQEWRLCEDARGTQPCPKQVVETHQSRTSTESRDEPRSPRAKKNALVVYQDKEPRSTRSTKTYNGTIGVEFKHGFPRFSIERSDRDRHHNTRASQSTVPPEAPLPPQVELPTRIYHYPDNRVSHSVNQSSAYSVQERVPSCASSSTIASRHEASPTTRSSHTYQGKGKQYSLRSASRHRPFAPSVTEPTTESDINTNNSHNKRPEIYSHGASSAQRNATHTIPGLSRVRDYSSSASRSRYPSSSRHSHATTYSFADSAYASAHDPSSPYRTPDDEPSAQRQQQHTTSPDEDRRRAAVLSSQLLQHRLDATTNPTAHSPELNAAPTTSNADATRDTERKATLDRLEGRGPMPYVHPTVVDAEPTPSEQGFPSDALFGRTGTRRPRGRRGKAGVASSTGGSSYGGGNGGALNRLNDLRYYNDDHRRGRGSDGDEEVSRSRSRDASASWANYSGSGRRCHRTRRHRDGAAAHAAGDPEGTAAETHRKAGEAKEYMRARGTVADGDDGW